MVSHQFSKIPSPVLVVFGSRAARSSCCYQLKGLRVYSSCSRFAWGLVHSWLCRLASGLKELLLLFVKETGECLRVWLASGAALRSLQLACHPPKCQKYDTRSIRELSSNCTSTVRCTCATLAHSFIRMIGLQSLSLLETS